MSYGSDLYKDRERAYSVTDKKKADLKAAQKKDATAEERELAASDSGTARHISAWERDAEAAKAQAAARKAAAESATERTGSPEVPGQDTYTHGGSGAPPNVDPEVQALIDSGVPLEVGGDNKLREVKGDKTG